MVGEMSCSALDCDLNTDDTVPSEAALSDKIALLHLHSDSVHRNTDSSVKPIAGKRARPTIFENVSKQNVGQDLIKQMGDINSDGEKCYQSEEQLSVIDENDPIYSTQDKTQNHMESFTLEDSADISNKTVVVTKDINSHQTVLGLKRFAEEQHGRKRRKLDEIKIDTREFKCNYCMSTSMSRNETLQSHIQRFHSNLSQVSFVSSMPKSSNPSCGNQGVVFQSPLDTDFPTENIELSDILGNSKWVLTSQDKQALLNLDNEDMRVINEIGLNGMD